MRLSPEQLKDFDDLGYLVMPGCFSEEEMARRKAAWQAPPPRYQRGYGAMFSTHIGQADEGCDFDFLAAGARVPEPEIH